MGLRRRRPPGVRYDRRWLAGLALTLPLTLPLALPLTLALTLTLGGSLVVTVPSMACDDARTVATEECQKPSADVIMSPSALTACPSDVELFGSGEYPDGETSVRPLIFKWETSAEPEPEPEPDPKTEPETRNPDSKPEP